MKEWPGFFPIRRKNLAQQMDSELSKEGKQTWLYWTVTQSSGLFLSLTQNTLPGWNILEVSGC